jgi:hypothetical protein
MTRETSTTDLLAAARVAADQDACRTSHLFKELDARIKAGEPLPKDWLPPTPPAADPASDLRADLERNMKEVREQWNNRS